MKKLLITLLFFVPSLIFAQNEVEMADTFRADGKIYVVVAIIAIIFSGIVFYLIQTDRRLSQIEKQLD